MKKQLTLKIILFLFILLASSFLSYKAECKEIKIGLAINDQPIIIGASTKASLINSLTNKTIIETKKLDPYLISNHNGLVNIIHKPSNTILGSFTGPIKLVSEKNDGLVCYNKKWYRGELLIFTNGDKKNITVVNDIDLEDYLLSVVPSEIPSKWHKEVLKAQTVAARSYALGYLGRRKQKGYDLEATVEDQVYLGVQVEKHSTSQAVKETKGTILVDKDNKPLIALFHSSAGGYTDSIENLWDEKPSIHIQPRPDYDDNSPYFTWHRNYSIIEINKFLNPLNIGEIKNIVPLSRSIALRVMWLNIIGTKGNTKIRGEELRKYLKLPSSKFNLIFENNQVKFAGRGYGHGLGLSQWGSKALAEHGFNYQQILAHYYPGTMLIKITAY